MEVYSIYVSRLEIYAMKESRCRVEIDFKSSFEHLIRVGKYLINQFKKKISRRGNYNHRSPHEQLSGKTCFMRSSKYLATNNPYEGHIDEAYVVAYV